MKNFFKFALALVIALSMTACGGDVQMEDPEIQNDPQQNIQPEIDNPAQSSGEVEEVPVDSEDSEDSAQSEISELPTESETPEDPEIQDDELPEEDNSFDPYWAGDEFEMPIPEPPYSCDVKFRNNVYEISTSSSDEVLSGTVEDIKNYCETLKLVGYNINVNAVDVSGFTEDRPGFLFSARSSNGGYVELIYDGNGYKLFADVSSVENNGEPEESAFDTTWANNEYERLIPKPPFEGWTGEMKGSNTYELFTSKAKEGDSLDYYDVFQAYLDSLKSLGFSIDGQVYSCRGFDEFGNEFEFKCGDGCAWITIMPVENLSAGSEAEKETNTPDVESDSEFSIDAGINASEIEFLMDIVPAGVWTVEAEESDKYPVNYIMNSGNITFDALKTFVSELEADNYSVFEIIAFDGNYGEYQAEKNENGTLCIVNIQYDGNSSVASIIIMKRAIDR